MFFFKNFLVEVTAASVNLFQAPFFLSRFHGEIAKDLTSNYQLATHYSNVRRTLVT
jgi:hypothetical protein